MITSTLDDLISTICPELAASPSVDVYVDIAKGMTSLDAFGENLYNLAVTLRAAHEFTLDTTRPMGDGGRITGKTEGRTSVQYEFGGNFKSSVLDLTQYGSRLKKLGRQAGLAAEVT